MKTMKSIKIFFLLSLGVLGLFQLGHGQQDAQYSMYMFNRLVINPAYAGARQSISITGLVRKQWVGVNGAPTSASLSVHAPSRNERHSFGAAITEDNIGITNSLGVLGYYAFRIPLGKAKLSLGLDAGALFYRNDWTRVYLHETDTQIPNDVQNRFLPIAGTGIFFNTKRFFAGVSMPNIIPNKYSTVGVDLSQDEARQVLHVFANAGYTFALSKDVGIRPSVLMKYAYNAPIQFDINLGVLFKEMLWVGASYRTGDAMVFMAEYIHKGTFRVGYAYDWTVTELSKVSSGSHELMLGVDLGIGKRKIITPRYF